LKVDWDGIDWSKCHQQVRKLQTRIVKATQEGRWGKVKTLQWLLTHSYSGKAIAVKRVTENKGKKTPGWIGKPGQLRKPNLRPCYPSKGVVTNHFP
jgi:RNA-directed DNA polymerase